MSAKSRLLSWGFVLLQDERAPKRVTNTRDDKISSRFWKDSFEQRRCLIPASSFCEPHDGRKPATWHWFSLKGDEPRPLFAFPGIWRRWKGPVKKDGPTVDIGVYSFVTTLPNAKRSTNYCRSGSPGSSGSVGAGGKAEASSFRPAHSSVSPHIGYFTNFPPTLMQRDR